VRILKWLFVVLLCAVLTVTPGIPVFAADILVLVDGSAVEFDQPPIIENGRTLVPYRAICEALGAAVEWVESTRTVIVIKDDTTVSLQTGSDILRKNDELITIDVPAKIAGDRILVPVRAIAESFDADVYWDQDTQTVIITTAGPGGGATVAPEEVIAIPPGRYINRHPGFEENEIADPPSILINDDATFEYYSIFMDIVHTVYGSYTISGDVVSFTCVSISSSEDDMKRDYMEESTKYFSLRFDGEYLYASKWHDGRIGWIEVESVFSMDPDDEPIEQPID